MLVRLSYISLPVGDLIESVKAFLPNAEKANKAHGITTFLVLHRKFFYQQIEGNHGEVCRLYKNIVNDPRHKDVFLISYNVVEELKFPLWDMAVAALPVEDAALGEEIVAANTEHGPLENAATKLQHLIDAELTVKHYVKNWL